MNVVYEDFEVLDHAVPYRSGFLGFREVPAYTTLIDRLSHRAETHPNSTHRASSGNEAVARERAAGTPSWPQVFLVDGYGVLHHRRCGSASHLGVQCNIPTIGVAKTLLQLEGLQERAVRRALTHALDASASAPPATAARTHADAGRTPAHACGSHIARGDPSGVRSAVTSHSIGGVHERHACTGACVRADAGGAGSERAECAARGGTAGSHASVVPSASPGGLRDACGPGGQCSVNCGGAPGSGHGDSAGGHASGSGVVPTEQRVPAGGPPAAGAAAALPAGGRTAEALMHVPAEDVTQAGGAPGGGEADRTTPHDACGACVAVRSARGEAVQSMDLVSQRTGETLGVALAGMHGSQRPIYVSTGAARMLPPRSCHACSTSSPAVCTASAAHLRCCCHACLFHSMHACTRAS